MNKKIETKDLINLGVFTALYIVMFFAAGMIIGYIPFLYPLNPVFCSLIGGIPVMLFLTKVQKFGMITLMGTLASILMSLVGQPWFIALPSGIIMSFLGDLIMRAGEYRKWKCVCLGYIVFSEWFVGLILPLFVVRGTFIAQIRGGYGDVYADMVLAITPLWVLPLIVMGTALGALGGAFLGRAILKKHFLRAGIL
jgi:energy-coupling factor transport system substrate-specific component